MKPAIETFAKIKVIGVGGSGGSAVNRMIKSRIKGIEFIAANTDVQALHHSQAPTKLHLGKTVTRGLGAGMNPEVGKAAAEETQNEIREALKGADMVFITCGLGGGTGSGAAPVIAEIARDVGALTVAFVTKPFSFEGAQRMDIAEKAQDMLGEQVDTIIVIPNDRLLSAVEPGTSLLDAFVTVDDVLRQGVQGISELITVPGLINVDFADVKAIMVSTGTSLMGIGVASGENRAIEAAKQAIESPLLDVSIEGAKGILFTITGSKNLSMHEVSEIAEVITVNADENAKVIFGAVIDETLDDELRVCVIATGFDGDSRSYVDTQGQTRYSENRFLKKEVPVRSGQESGSSSTPKKETVQATVGEKDEDDDVTSFVKKVLPAEVNRKKREKQVAGTAGADEEDLEIPTFLRRKMMQ